MLGGISPGPRESVWPHTDGRAIVEPPIDIDMYSTPQLREDMVTAAAKSENGDVIVLFGRVVFFDSAGLGVLIGAYKRAREYTPPATVYLVGVPDRIRVIFRVTGTEKFFTFVEALDELPAPSIVGRRA